jgi:hypothetical protein
MISVSLLMCPGHWRKVPPIIRARVWRHYQPGQEFGHVPVSEKYLEAIGEARDAVRAKEAGPPN